MHGELAAERSQPILVAGGFEPDDDPDSAEAIGDRPMHIMADRALGDAAGPARGAASCSRRWWRWRWRSPRSPCRRPDNARRAPFRASTWGAWSSATASTPRTSAWKSSLRATKSVSELTSTTTPRLRLDRHADKTLGRHAPALLGRLGEALLAQPVDRLLDVAVGLAQRILAIHHARAGLFAQILDQPRGNGRHGVPLHSQAPRPTQSRRGDATSSHIRGRAAPRPSPRIKKPYSAAISARACSLHLSRATRPLNLRSASSFAASSGVIAASCQ